MNKTDYCSDFLNYRRRKPTVVTIGDIALGGNYPIRIQSMTNTDTSDVHASTEQIIRIAKEGADIVRLTVPGQKDAESLKEIKDELKKRSFKVPLVADIHFNPRLAYTAATIVDKVRINPGNFTDRKLSKEDDNKATEAEDLRKLRSEFLNLIDICRKHNTALRIGTNHGSLSDRIVNKYGDTVDGMAESAMEFLRICKEVGFDNVVVSMKSSNTRVMVYATRLLVSKMLEEGMEYPLHLGVTEAGEGEDGRIKSAVGIGALLADGIGETIRVSLTEDPEKEIPVARKLVNYFSERENHPRIPAFGKYPVNPYDYTRRITRTLLNIGGNQAPVVFYNLAGDITADRLKQIGWHLLPGNLWQYDEPVPDIIVVDHWPKEIPKPLTKTVISRIDRDNHRIIDYIENFSPEPDENRVTFVTVKASDLQGQALEELAKSRNLVFILETDNPNGYADQRAAIFRLINSGCEIPVILRRNYKENIPEDFQLKSAADLGGLFIDGLGDGIWLENSGALTDKEIINTSFGILQAGRVRTSKTEYISCPSCGRTLFDLQSTTRKIRERTQHLKGLKIGIMGCIVNGPGEMADADYGYVGTGFGKVTLYKQKQVIKRNVPEEDAVDELISLIKEYGDWVEP